MIEVMVENNNNRFSSSSSSTLITRKMYKAMPTFTVVSKRFTGRFQLFTPLPNSKAVTFPSSAGILVIGKKQENQHLPLSGQLLTGKATKMEKINASHQHK